MQRHKRLKHYRTFVICYKWTFLYFQITQRMAVIYLFLSCSCRWLTLAFIISDFLIVLLSTLFIHKDTHPNSSYDTNQGGPTVQSGSKTSVWRTCVRACVQWLSVNSLFVSFWNSFNFNECMILLICRSNQLGTVSKFNCY